MKINEITNEGFLNAMKGVVNHYVKDWFNLTDEDLRGLYGSAKSADIIELQNKLKAAGVDVPTTGKLDEPTKTAIKQNPQVVMPPSALKPGVNYDVPTALRKQKVSLPQTPAPAAGVGQKFPKATQAPMVPPSQQVAQRQQATASTPAPAAPATPAGPVMLGGKKLDPRNPNDAKVLAALQAQQATQTK